MLVDDPALPRPVREAALNDLMREDLEIYAAGDLEERIESLEQEIARTRSALAKKQAGRAAADALFSLPGG